MANNNNSGGRRNPKVVQGSQQFIDILKNEIAAELGVPNYDQVDKGDIPARFHGAVGGTITKRLIELGQQALMNNGLANVNQSALNVQQYRNEMIQDLQSGGVQQAQGQVPPTNMNMMPPMAAGPVTGMPTPGLPIQ